MIVNLNKFQAILFNKSKLKKQFKETMGNGNKKIECFSLIKVLGIETDEKLNFNDRVNVIYRSAANQLNASVS